MVVGSLWVGGAGAVDIRGGGGGGVVQNTESPARSGLQLTALQLYVYIYWVKILNYLSLRESDYLQ